MYLKPECQEAETEDPRGSLANEFKQLKTKQANTKDQRLRETEEDVQC